MEIGIGLSVVKECMRQGRYRFQMIEEKKLAEWAPALSSVFEQWMTLLKKGELAEWEFVAYYLIVFVFLNRPQEKWGNAAIASLTSIQKRNLEQVLATIESSLRTIVPKESWKRLPACLSWVYGPMLQLRGVPAKVLWSLQGWRAARLDLLLMHRVPLAQELLALQVKGQRCVSALIRSDEIKEPVETGRDVWSFCLHDLLHASHFYGDPELIGSQKYLSSLFLRAWEQSSLRDWLQHDPQLATEFEYVAADMNAHPVYIFFSFYAKILEFFKRREGYRVTAPLPHSVEEEWRRQWRNFLSEFVDSPSSLEVFAELPRTESSGRQIKYVEQELSLLGQMFQST